jgi:hypothetical protein
MHEPLLAYYERLLAYRRLMYALATHPTLKADWAREIRAVERLRDRATTPTTRPLAA